MKLGNDAESWGLVQRLLHWATAAIILFLLAVGVYMANFVDDLFARFALTQTHKSWGVVVFALGLARLGWRLASPAAPGLPAGTKRWEAAAARLTHVGFYALMIWIPVSGWLMASASTLQDDYGVKNMVFGLFELPDPFVPGDLALETALKTAHIAGAVALGALLLLHVAAALKHHFVLRDGVLRRMSWGR